MLRWLSKLLGDWNPPPQPVPAPTYAPEDLPPYIEGFDPPLEDGVVWTRGPVEVRIRWIGGAVSIEAFEAGEKIHSHLTPGEGVHYQSALSCVQRFVRRHLGEEVEG